MQYDKWVMIVEKAEENFGLLKKEERALTGSAPGRQEIIEFNSPRGKIRLVWTEKARLEKLKTTYSRRIGSQVNVQATYSQEEKVHFIEAYHWNPSREEWEPFEFNGLN